ncbi:RES family NAD+ phosphorylase [Mycobacterium sp. ITM-2016-00317]|uniref:RES family NAD+ phosphorylase n=1 Tax=Mycobacterium sp. ITM-2016-00317 TaxID=2099694 RepID=UPI0037C70C27
MTFRRFGPLHRFDHHHEANPPQLDPDGRRVLYVGADLATSASEVFGDAGIAAVCPRYRVSVVAPTAALPLFDLTKSGAAMAIGALPSLADGHEARALTQQWARAIFEDQPAGAAVRGVRYRTAHNFGYSIALWDSDDRVEVVRDSTGRPQDHALDRPALLGRLQVEMRKRRISVTTVPESDCTLCRRG